ncbi:hypothetical protein AAF712_011910 [Marasmius tenuissimus]|uniref:Uncharacterized protein n=1 Tax=Marasmius tenuissimus TaxID=585030 RepID=A0ABR2ZJ66_9AGAR
MAKRAISQHATDQAAGSKDKKVDYECIYDENLGEICLLYRPRELITSQPIVWYEADATEKENSDEGSGNEEYIPTAAAFKARQLSPRPTRTWASGSRRPAIKQEDSDVEMSGEDCDSETDRGPAASSPPPNRAGASSPPSPGPSQSSEQPHDRKQKGRSHTEDAGLSGYAADDEVDEADQDNNDEAAAALIAGRDTQLLSHLLGPSNSLSLTPIPSDQATSSLPTHKSAMKQVKEEEAVRIESMDFPVALRSHARSRSRGPGIAIKDDPEGVELLINKLALESFIAREVKRGVKRELKELTRLVSEDASGSRAAKKLRGAPPEGAEIIEISD